MSGYVYKTTNLLNNKMYIGKSSGEFKPNYLGSGILIKRALNKYGKNKFKLEVIVYVEDKQKLDELEKQYIKEYREKFGKESLYNVADGGEGGATRFGPHSEETKNKIHLSNLGKKRSLEFKQRMRLFSTGRICSEETKKKLKHIRGFLGKHHSEETKEKMRIAHLGNKSTTGIPCSEETKEKIRLAFARRRKLNAIIT